MALTDEEFDKQFHAEATPLRKIKLSIREDRYTIWVRKNPPNFPDEYLRPILNLPDSTPVTRKPRKSGGSGLGDVIELRYDYREMGQTVSVYLKGYFAKDENGKWVINFTIQSLKDNSEDV